jgi:predicted nucleic acid-binding protein
MKRAYVDSSCLVALAFGDGKVKGLRKRLRGFDQLLSSNLLEAEVRAAMRREGVDTAALSEEGKGGDDLLSWVDWVMPSRPLSVEIQAVLTAGYVRGADLWHLATALYLAQDPAALPFLTLDQRQGEVARTLGFPE